MNNNNSIFSQKSRHTGLPTCCAEHSQDSVSISHAPATSAVSSCGSLSRTLDAGLSLGPGSREVSTERSLLGYATESHSALINQALIDAPKGIGGGHSWVEGVEIERLDTQTGAVKTFAILPDGREVEQVDSEEEKKKKNKARAQRWRLLETAQAILQAIDHRTCGCMRYVQGGGAYGPGDAVRLSLWEFNSLWHALDVPDLYDPCQRT